MNWWLVDHNILYCKKLTKLGIPFHNIVIYQTATFIIFVLSTDS